ncbi:MAG: DUF3575 domain-containing protein [Flavobacteriia bacterium]|nr:DUF3575 domain-containing protein [Flavobacteriia bacterium]
MRTLKNSLLLFALIGLSATTYGQSRGGGNIDVQLNIANIAFGNYSAFVGYNMEKDLTLGGVLGYQNFSIGSTTSGEEISYTGFYIAPEARFYFDPSRSGNDGWYGMGYLKFRSAGTSGEPYLGQDVDGNTVSYDQSNNGLALGIGGGRMWTTRFGVTFGAWVGAGYYLFDVESTSVELQEQDIVSNLPSLDFRFGVNVGYRF